MVLAGTITGASAPAVAQQTGGTVQLNEIVVQGKDAQGKGAPVGTNGPTQVKGYVADNVSAATKTNTPLVKVPASVSVVTRQNLDDRNVQSLNDALAYTPGAEVNVFGYDPRFDQIYIRGFSTIYDGIYRDGLRVANAAGAGAIFKNEPYGFDAITILRGPSASTYGFGSPGGIVDITSKRPVFTQFGEVQLQFGNYDRKQGNFDIGGPVEGSNGTMAYRLTGVFRDSSGFPLGPDDRIDIAPAFTYAPDGATSITFLSEYLKARFPGNVSLTQGPNFSVTNIPSGDPAFSTSTQEQWRVGYAFQHEFSKDFIIRQNLRYSGLAYDWSYVQNANLTPGATSLARSDGRLLEGLNNLAVDNQVEKHFNFGPTKHTVLLGLDYSHSDFTNTDGFNSNAPPLNLVNFNFGQQFIPSPALTNHVNQTQDQLGVYLQDQIDWDRLALTLSGRHDNVQTSTQNLPVGAAASQTHQGDDAFTGRAGLSYRVVDGVYPYASYATTFVPNLGTGEGGVPFAPTRGDQKEAGVKTQIPNTNLHIHGAVFEIVESNILRADPTDPTVSEATGRVRSRGYEVEAVDNIAPGTNVTASYTHVDLRFLDNQVAPTGNQLSGIPGDTVTGFAKYHFQMPGVLGGLALGGGVRYAGWSFADDANTGVNHGYALFDAVASYDFDHLDPRLKGVTAQINGYNIFDRYATTCQAGYCYRIQPATVIGSLIYRW